MGIELHALHGPVNFDKLHELQHARTKRLFGDLRFVHDDGFGDLRADRHAGVERGHRVLKDHGEKTPAQLLELLFRIRRDVCAVYKNFSRHARVFGQQAHNGLEKRALAAAGFSDDGQHLARVQRQVNAPHRLHGSARGVVADVQVLKL